MKTALVQELEGRILQIDEWKEIGRFGSEMLRYNVVDGILGAELHNVDQEMRYLYRVRDMITLSEYFERGDMSVIGLTGLLEQLVQILTCCQEYFLDEKNLLMQCDFMFWDEKQQQLWIPYLDGYDKKVNEGISRMLEKFMDTMNHQDKELAFLVYGLHRISRDRHFDLHKLSDFLDGNRKSQFRKGVKTGGNGTYCSQRMIALPRCRFREKKIPGRNQSSHGENGLLLLRCQRLSVSFCIRQE